MMRKLGFYLGLITTVAIPLGTRVLLQKFTPGFHEYETIFLYASDIPLVLFAIFTLRSAMRVGKNYAVPFGLLLLSAGITSLFAESPHLAWYGALRLLLAIGFALGIASYGDEEKRKKIFLAVIAAAFLEGVIAVLQFARQGSIGLGWLGESPFGVLEAGTAKAVLGDARVVRAYGTFPHPNMLGAFLTMGLAFIYHAWFSIRLPRLAVTRSNYRVLFKKYLPILLQTVLLSVALFFIVLGIAITFSRVAWVLAVIISLGSLAAGFVVKAERKQALKLGVVLCVAGYLLYAIVSPFTASRASVSLREPSVTERISYARVGVALVAAHPGGVGLGNQVLVAVHEGAYVQAGMLSPRLWQPVHNTFLLIANELGILGFVGIVLLMVQLVVRGGRNLLAARNLVYLELIGIVVLFGCADHFFWTLQQGRLMFWLVIGIVLAAISLRSDIKSRNRA
jgi:O-antigen ligase